MPSTETFYGAGGRKRSTARVFLIPAQGEGKFTVNKKTVADYFPEVAAVDRVYQPLNLLGLNDILSQYDIKATVKGGGKTGQRDAISLALAKALVMLESKKPGMSQHASEEEGEGESGSTQSSNDALVWRKRLRKAGMLTTDSRRVEPKRYGLDKARKRAPLVKR